MGDVQPVFEGGLGAFASVSGLFLQFEATDPKAFVGASSLFPQFEATDPNKSVIRHDTKDAPSGKSPPPTNAPSKK